MNRFIWEPYLSVNAADMLTQNRDNLIALAKLAAGILGTDTLLNGLECTPTSPASLNVEVAPGEIYSMQQTDATAYGNLPADTDLILKQGIVLTTTTLNCPAPSTVGNSINYLIQVTFAEVDTDSATRTFYNSALTPPNYTQTIDQYREDQCIVAVKAGTSAPTGTQTTPTPDAGYVGAWVVTVANGQTTITSGNITEYSSAPFIGGTLPEKISQTEGDARYALKTAATAIINTQVFTASGTYTPSSDLLYAIVEVVGGGGGGGGSTGNSAHGSAGAGGGGGGYARKVISAATIGASQTVTIGAGGTAGASGNNIGGTGGTTSFGALLSATGGGGGQGAPAISNPVAFSNGGPGGSGSGGDFNTDGDNGRSSSYGHTTGPVVASGAGGSSFFGGGANGSTAENVGAGGASYGGGGAGGSSFTTSNTGGAGASGVVIVTEFCAV
jgi:hypothetical protein